MVYTINQPSISFCVRALINFFFHKFSFLSHTLFPLKGDFGLGYGIYFSTLRSFALLSLVAGILNLPNLLYFSSNEYSNGQMELPGLLKGSAICTGTVRIIVV